MQTELKNAFFLSNDIWDAVSDLEISGENRPLFAGACYFVALEHHLGIAHLFRNGIVSSALALTRPLNESFIRAAWLHHSASDQDVSNFEASKSLPPIKEMLTALKDIDIFGSGVLTASHEANWKMLCGFSHTGFEQVILNTNGNIIERNCSTEQIASVLRYAGATALHAAMGMALLAECQKCSARLLELAKDQVA